MDVYEKIAAQQNGKENTPAYMVGEQLKDIIRGNADIEELVTQDLDVEEMSIEKCAAKIKAHADEKHKKLKGNCICVTPIEADKIIREFYGLPEAAAKEEKTVQPPAAPAKKKAVSLFDLI
ncbi:MAG: hypothetical protein Q4G33_14650 [bacterium]|nr:hypothetical protein [bacterium]